MRSDFNRLASAAMMNHGLNRDHHQQLARWAESAFAAGHTARGVLVTGDGRLHAETIRPSPPPPDATGGRGSATALPPWQIVPGTWRVPRPVPVPPTGISEALDVIQEATGLPVAHIVYQEVCEGWVG